MAQVIYAESGDELGALVQKLETAQETEIVLLVPKHTPFLEDSLHWNLLQRHVRSLGKLVVVVTRDRDARHSARRAGFAVYGSLRRLKFTPERNATASLKPFLKKGRGSSIPVALGIIVLGSLLFLGLAAYLATPTGSVVLRPAVQDLALTITVKAIQQTKEVDPTSGQIPARLIEAQLQDVETIETTGRKSTPTNARGEVTLLNRTASPVVLPVATLISSGQGSQFITLEEVVLAPSGGTARTPIVATQPGPRGNVPSMAIDRAVEEPHSFTLAVWNELPTFGGVEEDVSVVSPQDQSNLRSRLAGRLTKVGQDQLQALKKDSESIYPATISLSALEESFDKELGAEASTVSLRMKGSISGLAFDGEDVNQLALKSLEAQTQRGFRLRTETLQVTPLEAYDWGADWVFFRALAKAKASETVNEDIVAASLRGMNPVDARAYLEKQFTQKEQVSITIKPVSLDWLPIYFWKLEVRY